MISLSYKVDKTYFSSQYGTYQIFQNWIVTLPISGSIATGHFNLYVVTFTFSKSNAKGRAFIQRHDGSLKAPFSAGARISNYNPTYQIYQFAGGETVRTSMRYTNNGEALFLFLSITNDTGSTINLITQQLDLTVAFYDGPVA